MTFGGMAFTRVVTRTAFDLDGSAVGKVGRRRATSNSMPVGEAVRASRSRLAFGLAVLVEPHSERRQQTRAIAVMP